MLRIARVQVRERRFAPFVRLEVGAAMPRELVDFLVHELSLRSDQDVYRVPHVVELAPLAKTLRHASAPPAATLRVEKYVCRTSSSLRHALFQAHDRLLVASSRSLYPCVCPALQSPFESLFTTD